MLNVSRDMSIRVHKGIYCRPAACYDLRSFLVVEQANVLLDESDAERLGRFKDRLIILAAAWSRNVLGS